MLFQNTTLAFQEGVLNVYRGNIFLLELRWAKSTCSDNSVTRSSGAPTPARTKRLKKASMRAFFAARPRTKLNQPAPLPAE